MIVREIEWRGDVQRQGFRRLVESEGYALGLRGIVYNSENSVVSLAEGEEELVEKLLKYVQEAAQAREIYIEDVRQHETDVQAPLPPFTQVKTDTTRDILHRLDDGVEKLGRLDNIEKNTNELVEGQNQLVEGQNQLVEGQNQLVEGQNQMIKVLKQIEKHLKS